MTSRVVSWFSCGAASAVATKMALDEYEGDPDTFIIAYCEIQEEHPDNKRFLKDCEEWFGKEITILGNDKYNRSTYNVWEREKFLVGPSGARCTAELKKKVRFRFEEPGDVLVFGFTVDEKKRAERLMAQNFDTMMWPILIEKGVTKENTLAIIQDAGIELPEMYKLGYRNNNCVGCVKGGIGYWNKIRKDFPEVFDRMAKLERTLDVAILKDRKMKKGVVTQSRLFLDELPPNKGHAVKELDIDCGIFCGGPE